MTIAVTGASGFVGRRVAERLRGKGQAVRAVSTRAGIAAQDLEGCGAVIHLAGEPVAQRWTKSARERIEASRIQGTRALVAAIGGSAQRPKVLISASGIGYYGSQGDTILREESPPGDDFLGRLAVAWEREAQAAEQYGVRVVMLRLAMVLGRGGALARMLPPFRLGLGGRIGSGRQWMSWIHLEDLVSLISFALAAPQLRGAVNATSPDPVTNAAFTRELARALHRPAIFPVPPFALKMLFGEMSRIILASQRAIPEAVLHAGFEFRYPEIGPALRDVLA